MDDTMAKIDKTEFFNNINDSSIRSIRSSCFALLRSVTRIPEQFQLSVKNVGDRTDLRAAMCPKKERNKERNRIKYSLKEE